MILRADIDQLNEETEQWADDTQRDIVAEIGALGIKHSKYSPNPRPLAQALRKTLRKTYGAIDRISYSFPRSGIFLHKGVSRGHGKDNPRQAKEFYNPVIKRNIDKLADLVAENQGNLIINSIEIK